MILRNNWAPFTLVVGLLVGAGPAGAQTLNIDFGFANPTPSNSFGAAAAQPGTWNSIVTTGLTSNLMNLAGAATGVGLTLVADNPGGLFGSGVGDIQDLRGDNFYSDPGRHWTVTLAGLQNGQYDAYFYALTLSSVPTRDFTANGVSVPSLVGNEGTTLIEGTDGAKATVTVGAGQLIVASSNTTGYGGLAGMQLVFAGETPAVPEPGSILLFLPALGAYAFIRRTRRMTE